MADNTDEPVPAVRRAPGDRGLFVLYGLIISVAGLFDTEAEIAKAQGVRINLWTGLAMLALGALFLAWQWWRPLELGSPGDRDRPADAHQLMIGESLGCHSAADSPRS